MDRCWGEFYKSVLGPLVVQEDAFHPEGCTMFTCKHEPDPRVSPEAHKMQLWDAFAVRHYKAPQIGGSIERALSY